MRGDIALAGFMMTAEEWHALDPAHRAQLIAAATRKDDHWVVAPATGVLSEPNTQQDDSR
jgi:hypothetical protein